MGVPLETSVTFTTTEPFHYLSFSHLFFKATEKCTEAFQFFDKHGFAAKKKDVTEVVTQILCTGQAAAGPEQPAGTTATSGGFRAPNTHGSTWVLQAAAPAGRGLLWVGGEGRGSTPPAPKCLPQPANPKELLISLH